MLLRAQQSTTQSAGIISRALSGVGGAFQSVGRQMQSTGVTASLYLTAPIVGIGGASVAMANSFTDSMDMIVGLVGVAREQTEAWTDDILRLSRTTAREAQNALWFHPWTR